MKPKVTTGVARRLLVTVAVIAFAPVAFAQSHGEHPPHPLTGANQTFFVLNNPNDPMFNQLLGINGGPIDSIPPTGRVIVGYFGDGKEIPNFGYVLVPKNHYSDENFDMLAPGSQTQAIGINNNAFPDIVGFYTDVATGVTHGFLDSNGVQLTIDDPAGSPPNVTTPAQNLLGINNLDKAAGFWTDNKGNTHGFIVEINTQSPNTSKFIEIPPTTFPGAVAIQATSITNVDRVCGFWTDANGNNQGFTGFLNQMFFPFNISIPGMIVTSTSPFGCNDPGGVVGSFIDNKGNTHGFIFDGMTTHLFDAPGSSQKAAFGVAGTVINGINNQGEIVGFFSDGTNVNGFVDFAPPLDQ